MGVRRQRQIGIEADDGHREHGARAYVPRPRHRSRRGGTRRNGRQRRDTNEPRRRSSRSCRGARRTVVSGATRTNRAGWARTGRRTLRRMVRGDGNAAGRPPSVDALARSIASSGLPHALCVELARAAIAAGEHDAERLGRRAGELRRSLLGPVINATGVLLHTNLGRAPLAVDHPGAALNLELDLRSGERGSRQAAVGGLLARLTGAEAAMVVNNNAAAVLLVLGALAAGREVLVSRGESVEIGGGFRIPEVMAQSGARLVDVGTTNRTRTSRLHRRPGPARGRCRADPQGPPQQLPGRGLRPSRAGRRAGDARPPRGRRPRQRPARRDLPVAVRRAAGVAGRRAGCPSDAGQRRGARHVQRRQAVRWTRRPGSSPVEPTSSPPASATHWPAPCARVGTSSPRCRPCR